jgi:hypothetical protein
MAQAALKLKAEKEPVSERELAAILRDRVKLVELNQALYDAGVELNNTAAARRLADITLEAATLSKSLKDREENVVERLRRGVKVIGKIIALVQVIEGQCRPKWKEAFLALATRMKLNAIAEEKRVKKETEVPKEYRLTIG